MPGDREGASLPWLPDYLAEGLDIVSIGLNPSVPSAERGFAFANPRNRFWPALNRSRLAGEPLEPGAEAQRRLFSAHGIGFTDVVRRPTRGGWGLRAADYRAWAPELLEKLERYRPRIAWFHGKQAYRAFLRYALGRRDEDIPWGEQEAPIAGCVVFVTPNPSPANASYSLGDLAGWFDALADLRDRLKREGAASR